jgi:hypothetical protein
MIFFTTNIGDECSAYKQGYLSYCLIKSMILSSLHSIFDVNNWLTNQCSAITPKIGGKIEHVLMAADTRHRHFFGTEHYDTLAFSRRRHSAPAVGAENRLVCHGLYHPSISLTAGPPSWVAGAFFPGLISWFSTLLPSSELTEHRGIASAACPHVASSGYIKALLFIHSCKKLQNPRLEVTEFTEFTEVIIIYNYYNDDNKWKEAIFNPLSLPSFSMLN